MVCTNKAHPQFSFAGELLALLAPAPIFSDLSLIKHDLDCTGYHLRHALSRLQERGIKIVRRYNELAISRESMCDARIEGAKYEDLVYPDEPAANQETGNV